MENSKQAEYELIRDGVNKAISDINALSSKGLNNFTVEDCREYDNLTTNGISLVDKQYKIINSVLRRKNLIMLTKQMAEKIKEARKSLNVIIENLDEVRLKMENDEYCMVELYRNLLKIESDINMAGDNLMVYTYMEPMFEGNEDLFDSLKELVDLIRNTLADIAESIDELKAEFRKL